MADAVEQIQEAMHNLLNPQEKADFLDILNDYQCRKDVEDFTAALQSVLDTPAKREVVPLLRSVVSTRDMAVFEYRMMGGTHEYSRTLPRRLHSGSGAGGNNDRHLPQDLYTERPGSSSSLPARPYHSSLPGRTISSTIQRPRSVTDTVFSSTHLQKWQATGTPTNKKIYIDKRAGDVDNELGFSIRGGAEHGIGVYVSYVDVDSIAERQGLVPGDQIVCVNGTSFKKVTHSEAARVFRSTSQLEIEVRNVGRVPGSFETHQRYMWVDGTGRAVSPPPEVDRTGRYEAADERKSDLMLLKDSDERKVNLMVTDSKKLGIMMRGGSDFGLGIYITGVDQGSVAHNSGLKVGDQILDVNGQSFLDISHAEAARVLKSSNHLMITIKDVGKLPHARTTYDQTQWINGEHMSHRSGSRTKQVEQTDGKNDRIFRRGVGSQLVHSGLWSGQTTPMVGLLEDQARHLLTPGQNNTLNYYLDEYQSGNVTIVDLSLALRQLLDTQEKKVILQTFRGLINPRDIDKYDELTSERENSLIQSSSDDLAAYASTSGHSECSSGGSSFTPNVRNMPHDNTDALQEAIKEISEDILQHPSQSQSRHHGRNVNVHGRTIVTADVHRPPHDSARHKLQEEARTPSEDSGVDLNGSSAISDSNSLHQPHNKKWKDPSTTARVTLSTQKPVIINDFLRHVPSSTSGDSSDHEEHASTSSRRYFEALASTSSAQQHNVSFAGRPGKASTSADQRDSLRRLVLTNNTHKPVVLTSTGSQNASQLQFSDPRQRHSLSHKEDTGHSPGQLSSNSHEKTLREKKEHINGKQTKKSTLKSSARSNIATLPPGKVVTIHVPKTKKSLGLSIEGGANTRQPLPRIIGIQVDGMANSARLGLTVSLCQDLLPGRWAGGSAADCPDLNVGHILLKVNGLSLHNLEHEDCARVIAEAFRDRRKYNLELLVLDIT